MRQLSHPWQHKRRAVLGLPMGLALPMAQAAWAKMGTRMHSRPRERTACLLPLQPGTAIHGNVSLTPCRGLGERLEQLPPKCTPSD